MNAPASSVDRALAAWGDPLPDWIAALAEAADRRGQRAVGRQIGYSTGVVSTVLTNTYAARLDKVEQAVRGALMSETVACPVLGCTIGVIACMYNQDGLRLSPQNDIQRQLHATCPSCSNYRGQQQRHVGGRPNIGSRGGHGHG